MSEHVNTIPPGEARATKTYAPGVSPGFDPAAGSAVLARRYSSGQAGALDQLTPQEARAEAGRRARLYASETGCRYEVALKAAVADDPFLASCMRLVPGGRAARPTSGGDRVPGPDRLSPAQRREYAANAERVTESAWTFAKLTGQPFPATERTYAEARAAVKAYAAAERATAPRATAKTSPALRLLEAENRESARAFALASGQQAGRVRVKRHAVNAFTEAEERGFPRELIPWQVAAGRRDKAGVVRWLQLVYPAPRPASGLAPGTVNSGAASRALAAWNGFIEAEREAILAEARAILADPRERARVDAVVASGRV